MTEKLLQFIWRLQYYNSSELTTTDLQPLRIIYPGLSNQNQGPDFQNARILLQDVQWAGSIELHLRTSDWEKHKHTGDRHYENVILHVVWQHDKIVNNIPVLELSDRIPVTLLSQYKLLMEAGTFIPCAAMAYQVSSITWQSWKERLVAERLQRRADKVLLELEAVKGHWEELCWQQIAGAYGGKINAESFVRMAKSLTVPILSKCKNNQQQAEALLIGQAGLFDNLPSETGDEYVLTLKKEYEYQVKKFSLPRLSVPLLYFRMRPPGFPDIRLAQLASLVFQSSHLFSKIKEEQELATVRQWFMQPASKYWQHHYRLMVTSKATNAQPGSNFADHIIINTLCVLLFAYGQYHQQNRYKEKAVTWLMQLVPESNAVIRSFAGAGINTGNAMESQALLELKSQYCEQRRCLECMIGAALLRFRH